ncbi:hypothetical protein BHE74_00032309 [Ensete ventricosum]|nr:hypothetical protein BHE74_00032309 [Ensete ventricosum]
MFQLRSAAGSCKKVRYGGFYSNGYGAPVPEVLTAPVAYHAVVLRRGFRGSRDQHSSYQNRKRNPRFQY